MKPSDVALTQGTFENLKPLRAFLQREGIEAEFVKPPGKGGGG